MSLYESAKQESLYLEQKIAKLKKELAGLPEGELHIHKNGEKQKWFRSFAGANDKKRKGVFLKKTEKQLAEKLAQKRYFQLQLNEAVQEKIAIDAYITSHSKYKAESERIISSPAYYQLIEPALSKQTETISEWAKSSFKSNPGFIEQLVFPLPDGRLVRTKSEVLIGTALLKHGLSFQYECLLKIGHEELYPDFKIMHPKTYEFYYWEHFGALDKQNYIDRTTYKLNKYMTYGIYPEKNLLMTFESPGKPLDLEWVEKIIVHYFE